MNTRMSVLPLLTSMLLAAVALPASAGSAERPVVQLAQSGEIEVYYDEFGRRVIADAATGQIISIERARGAAIDGARVGSVRRYRQYDDVYDDPYYDNDPAALREPPPADFQDDATYQVYPESEGGILPGEFPPAPAGPGGVAENAPVYREPLPEPLPGQVLSPNVPTDVPTISGKADINIAKLQVVLDRLGASPGVIDARMGGNVSKALAAYNELTGESLEVTDIAAIDAALAATGGEAFVDYEITQEDAAGPYVASVPADYGEKALLDRLSYTSTLEMLAERFHMSEAYLAELNPGANFNRAGTIIKVARPGEPVLTEVTQIVADKGREQVRAYDATGRLIVAYPATIGSSDTPSPSGTVQVERIALNPEYTYNPKINFKQGENDKVLRIPPGPNGPVGTVWIALSKPTYGIHGTPEPSKIGKTNSNGCVRLTNWDAEELAKLVKKGVVVEFTE